MNTATRQLHRAGLGPGRGGHQQNAPGSERTLGKGHTRGLEPQSKKLRVLRIAPYGSRSNLVNGIMTEGTNDLMGSAPEEEYTGSSGGGTEKKINTPC